MPSKIIELGIDIVIGLVVLGVLFYFGRGLLDTVQASAKLDAALGNNAALAESGKAQNKGVDSLVQASEEKRKVSEAAVKVAGVSHYRRAAEIMVEACTWATGDAECAAGRIDRELGLK